MNRHLCIAALALIVACDTPPTPAGDTPGVPEPPVSAGEVTPATPTPAFYVARGVCPFECCHYGPWVANGAVDVHPAERTRDSVAFRIAAGDSLVADSGNVHILVPGLVTVQREVRLRSSDGRTTPAMPGDTVLVLEYHGEGYYNVRHRGKDAEVESFWDDRGGARLVREPQQEWWARVRAKDGRRGWVFMNDARIGGVDLCG